MDGENLSDFFEESDEILSILEALEDSSNHESSFEFQKAAAAAPPKCKRQKVDEPKMSSSSSSSHIAVERNRRKQMNHHLSVLRSLMPCFYVKRGDQASIIGGVINYINELQQVMQSLEAKKQRKAASCSYTSTSHDLHVLSPRLVVVSSPIPSPRKPPLSPRLLMNLPISPRTPTPSSPYKLHNLQAGSGYLNSPLSPCNSSASNSSINDTVNELVATSRSAIAEVEVKFCGPNLILKTVSHRIPGQVVKILSALQDLALEILQVNITKVDDQTMLNSFTIKIGIECQLSAEELADQIQRTFSIS